MTLDEAFRQAVAHHEANHLPESERLLRQVLAAQPNHAGALYYLAMIADTCGHRAAALELIQRSIALQPTAPAYTVLGAILQGEKRYPEAEQAFLAAARMLPDEPIVHNNLGSLYWTMKRYAEARHAYQRAVNLRPDFALSWHGLMAVAGDEGDHAAALAAGRRAAELGLDSPRFLADLAVAYQEAGQFQEALAAGERALKRDPSSPTSHHNLSQILLLCGDFERGWREHEWRWQTPEFPSPLRNFPQPQWDGSTGLGKTLLLHSEQGFGDAIMFARYIPLVAQRVRVVVECQPELVELFKTIPGPVAVIPRFADPGPFDFHLPFGSLPLIFRTTVDTIPAAIPYLSVNPARQSQWTDRVKRDGALRVGIAWAGRPSHTNDRNRSIALARFAPLAGVPSVTLYSLQKGDRAADAQDPNLPFRLIDLTSDLRDFADSAAFLSQLDLVVSVDTSIVHLAGALGIPVWVMIPFAPDWRWLIARPDDSPWYPSMRLFRQPAHGDWDAVIQRICAELAARAKSAN